MLLVVIAEATLLTAAEYYKVTNSPARYVGTQHIDPKRKELRKPTW